MSEGLAKGWASIRLEDLVSSRKGKKPDTSQPHVCTGFVPYLDIHAIETGHVTSYAEAKSSRLASCRDILVVWDGARSGWVGLGRDGAIGSTIMAIEPKCGIRESLYRWLQGQFHNINTNTRGTGIPHVDPEVFWGLEVPIPPLGEQRRIVAKLEALLGKVDACRARMDKIPVILKRFRQSVLAAACSGRLTADWRQLHPRCEPLNDNGSFRLEATDSDLPELPDTWKWVPLGNYGRCSRGRFSVRPRNDPSCYDGAYPFIQIGDLPPDGGWISAHEQTLNERGLSVSKLFPKGTVAIAIVGATIGNTGLLSYDMCFPDSMVGIETGSPSGNRYVEFYLRTRKNDIRQSSYAGGGQPNIKLASLNPYPLALPPLAEQEEIVRRVDALFAVADAIEARFQKAKAQVEKLTPSLLAKAFRGELVPQDPNDEPASVLLERIRKKQ